MNRFTAGQKLFTHGLTMKGKRVVVPVTFIEWLSEVKVIKSEFTGHVTTQDCVVKSGSIKLIDDSSTLYLTRAEAAAAL